jgi:hypothetical protein
MKLKGLWNVTVQRTTDNIMRKIDDKWWFDYKKNLARKRADRVIRKIESGNGGSHNRQPVYQ